MHILAVGPQAACLDDLVSKVRDSSLFSDVFSTERALAYHTDCSVYLCNSSGTKFVVKTYRRDILSTASKEQVALEINIHSSLQHQHIAGFLLAFEDSRSTHIVVEYAEGGDLRKHMPGRDEQRIRDFIVVPLLQSLTHVHNKGYSHRDLKPENVLVHQGSIKLADFGLALVTHISEDSCAVSVDSAVTCGSRCTVPSSGSASSMDSECSTSSCLSNCNVAGGTPLYAAPEVLRAMFRNHGMRSAVGPKNDIWALGVMVLEAYTGCHPFSPDHHHHENVLYSIAHHQKVNLPPTLSPEFASWLQLVLQRDPEQRPNAHEALEHPWLCKRYSDSEQVKLTSGAATQTAAVAHCSFSYVQPARPQALNVMGFECMSFEY